MVVVVGVVVVAPTSHGKQYRIMHWIIIIIGSSIRFGNLIIKYAHQMTKLFLVALAWCGAIAIEQPAEKDFPLNLFISVDDMQQL